jgi:hypothetical protein
VIIRTMLKAWSAARGRTIHPTRLKELVLAAEERGAVFRPVLHTLIDRAVQRDELIMFLPENAISTASGSLASKVYVCEPAKAARPLD